ncbi:Piwi-domain-containing protein [Lactifluus subvellereus]|nr:Piwi-domain-containing protein [Lactifluus subvellereus]
MNHSRGNIRGRGGNNVRRGRAGYRVSVPSSPRGGREGPGSAHSGAPPGAPLVYKEGQGAQVDTRIHTADELVARLQGLNLGPERPARPGWGTLGRVILVRTNSFPIELSSDTYYDYVMEISPEPESHVKRRILALFEQNAAVQPYINKIAHDGAQRLVAAQPLPQPLLCNVEYFEDGDDGPPQNADCYSVEVKFLRELPTAPLKLFQEGDVANIDKAKEIDPLVSALNLIMQRQAAQLGFRFGKNRYFFDDDHKELLGPRLLALMGFYSSVRPVYKQLMVNVNVCMAPFHQPGKLSDALRAFDVRSRGATPTLMAKVKVSSRYRGYKCVKPIFRVLDISAKKTTFPCEEYGGNITVETFFQRKYGIWLQEADTLPVIDIGKAGKPVYVPAELCEIEPGEPRLGRLGPKETAAMLRCASRKPAMNAQLIVERGLSCLGYTPGTPVLEAFGVRVSSEMSVIPARELPAPKVTYSKGSLQVKNGSWNLRDVKFHRGAKASNWKVLVVRDNADGTALNDTSDPRLSSFIEAFVGKCRSSGIDLSPRPSTILQTDELLPIHQDQKRRTGAITQISRTIELFGDMESISFILVLLPRQDDYLYPGIKRLCAVKFGVHSQCLWLQKALNPQGREQYLANVALKLNTKLGGINHLLEKEAMSWLTDKSTIMVGIDVTHPGAKSAEGTPSIVGVVASVDNDFVQFPASLRLQKSRREVSDALRTILKDMIVERLQAYRRHSKALPERMIVFRDGVSEGQYGQVLKDELPQIFAAFRTIDPENRNYHPILSIIVCGKRHNARFFPTDSAHADKNGNTRPGTVVDKGVTSVLDFDFYLQAHAGLLGTVKSTHYVVLYDESELGADDVQQGVHSASYLYARATKAVSLVPPAFYADILCERARYWIHEFLLAEGNGGGASASASPSRRKAAEDRVFEAAQRAWGDGLHPNLRDSMFYL